MRKYAENSILVLVFIFCVLLIPEKGRSIREAAVILPPLIILSVFGLNWLNDYDFNTPLFWGIVIFFVTTAISQLFTINFYRGVDQIRTFHLKGAALIFTFLFLLRKEENLKTLLWGITCSLILAYLFAYYNYAVPYEHQLYELQTHRPNEATAPIRPFGLHKNHFGALLSIYLPILFGFSIRETVKSKFSSFSTLCLYTIFLASLPIILMTQSRAAQGGFVISLLVITLLYLIKYQKTTFIYILTALILLLIIIVWIFFSFGLNRGTSALYRWDPLTLYRSLMRRYEVWSLALENTGSYRFFGLDFSQKSLHKVTAITDDVPDGGKGAVVHEHSMYVYFLVRSGVLGLLGFISLIVTVMWDGLRTIFRNNSTSTFILTAFVGSFFGSYIIRGVVTKFPNVYQVGTMLGFLLALTSINTIKDKT